MRRSVVIIGNFDGVHMGHQSLIALASKHAQRLGDDQGPLPVVAVTFWPHPMTVVAADRAPKLLCRLRDRIHLLKKAGVAQVRVIQFNREVAGWAPELFIERILLALNPAVVVVGENFRFGKGASGNVETLRVAGAGSFEVDAIALLTLADDAASSSLIREALKAGDVKLAARNLGRWFRVRGVVMVGDQRGHALGFPTANLPVGSRLAVPADGVYAGWLSLENEPGTKLAAAISVGTNPTFDGVERRVETHVLDRDDLQLYGEEIAVDFVAQLRGQLKFNSVEKLITQMREDASQARELLAGDPQPR